MSNSAAANDDPFDSSWIRQVLVGLVAIKIFGIVLIVDVVGLQAFDLPKSLFSRATEWLLIGALIAAVAFYGLAIVPRTRLHLAVAAFLLANGAAAIFAADHYIALYGDSDRYLGLTFVMDMAVLYAATAVAYRRDEDWVLLGAGVAAASVLVVAYAVVQYLGRDPVAWSADPRARPFSTFGNADFLGHYLSVAFGLGVAVAALGNGLPSFLRVFAALGALTALAAALATATRATLIAIPAVILIAALVKARAARERRSVGAVAVVTLSVAWLVVLLAFTPLGERMQIGGRGGAITDRLLLYEVAVRAFVDRPILGYGPDNFGVLHPFYQRQPEAGAGFVSVSPQNAAHSWPLQAAATTGIVGILSLCALILASTRSLWKYGLERRPVVAAAALLAAGAYWVEGLLTVGTISVDWLPWVVFGIAAALGGSRQRSRRRVGVARIAVTAIAGIACLLGGVSGIQALSANRDAAIARAYASSEPGAAVEAARSAVRKDSGRAEYWFWLGTALEAQASWSESAAAYFEAAMRAPYDWRNWAAVARTRARESKTDAAPLRAAAAALAAAQRTVEVAPNDIGPYAVLSETAYAIGEYDLALRAAVNGIVRYPAANYDALVARAAAVASNQETAKLLVQQALVARDTAALHLSLAQVLYRLGDRSAAALEARRTLDREPGNAEARRILEATER